jgi:hypothetical protein
MRRVRRVRRGGDDEGINVWATSAPSQGVTVQTVEAQMVAGNSINHLVDGAEVAEVVEFLCSPRSRAINCDALAAGTERRRGFTTEESAGDRSHIS